MIDDPKKTSPDDEYQFPQEEYAQASVSPTVSETSESPESLGTPQAGGGHGAPAWLANLSPTMKRVILIVIAVIVIIILFRVFSGNKQSMPILQPAPQPVVIQPINTDSQMLSSLNASSTQTESQINKLNEQISNLQSMIDQAQANNEKLSASVAQLTTQVNNIAQQLSGVMQKLMPKKAHSVVFHLRAVLPDRAWISSDHGKSLSITIGDQVPTYGTIKSIDAKNGVIETSSGRKIVYGSNDF